MLIKIHWNLFTDNDVSAHQVCSCRITIILKNKNTTILVNYCNNVAQILCLLKKYLLYIHDNSVICFLKFNQIFATRTYSQT